MHGAVTAWLVALLAGAGLSNPKAGTVEVTVRGRVVCLEGAEAACRRFGLSTVAGDVYSFMTEDARAEIFTDARVRERELEVKGWARAGDRTLEITKVFSVKDGKLYDLYYFCSVCNITSHTPGPCWCCRADFELKEEPHKP